MKRGLIVGLCLILLLIAAPVHAQERTTITYLHADIGDVHRYWYGQGEFIASDLGDTFTLHLNGNQLTSYATDAEISRFDPGYMEFASPAQGGHLHALFTAPRPEGHGLFTAHVPIPYVSEDQTPRQVQIQIENAGRILYLNGPVLFEDGRFSTQGSMKIIDLTTTETELTMIFVTELAYQIFSLLAGCLLFTLILIGLVVHRRKEIAPAVRRNLNRFYPAGRFPIQFGESEDGIRLTILLPARIRLGLRKIFVRDERGVHITIPRALIAGIFVLLFLYLVYRSMMPTVSSTFVILLPEVIINPLFVTYLALNGILIGLLLLSISTDFRGIVTGCRNIIADYQKDAERERAEDEERGEYFSRQYPRLSAVPIIGTIFRWMYAQTWFYCGLLLVVLLMGFGLRLKGLGAMEFREDEFQVIETAYGYFQTGTYYKWDFLTNSLSDNPYDRAWPHSWMIAKLFQWFGYSEWAARLPSLIFGTLLTPLSYFIGRDATDRKVVGLLLAAVVAFSTSMINLSQYARMYVVFIPAFVLGSYLLLRGLEGKSPWQFKDVPLLKWIVKHFDFDYRYLSAAGLVLTFSYLTHINTLIIGVGVFVFSIIMAILSREKKYIYLSGIFSTVLVTMAIGYALGVEGIQRHFCWIDIFAPTRLAYFSYLFDYPFGIYISALLLAVMLVLIQKNRKLLFYLCLTLTALIYFAFFSNRYASYVYISNYTVLAWLQLLPAAALIAYILSRRQKPMWQIGFSAVVLIAVFTPIVGTPGMVFDEYRAEDKSYGRFREAYAELNEGYRTGDLLMGQYLRRPYITISGDVSFKSLKNNQQYSFEEFLYMISQYDRIWITWETRKSYHLQPEIIRFVNSHFEKIHGRDVDNTNVELYLWDKGSQALVDLTDTYLDDNCDEWIASPLIHSPDRISIKFKEDKSVLFPLSLTNTGEQSVSVTVSVPVIFRDVLQPMQSDLLLEPREDATLYLQFRDLEATHNYILGEISLIASISGRDAEYIVTIPFEAEHLEPVQRGSRVVGQSRSGTTPKPMHRCRSLVDLAGRRA